jgi:hypothetical protein
VKIKTVPQIDKDFYHYNDAVKMENIQGWIEQCVHDLNNGHDYTRIASGDTIVVGLRFGDTVEIIVSRNYVEAACVDGEVWIS